MGSEDFLEGIRRVQAGDRSSEEALLRENMPLVAAIARRYQNCGLAQEDMLQLGSIGLLQALRRFDPDRGLCFSTYAVPLIAGEIRRFLRDDGMVKFSRETKSLALKIERVRREQGDLTVAELSSLLQVPPEDITAALASRTGALSLDAPTGATGPVPPLLPGPDPKRGGPTVGTLPSPNIKDRKESPAAHAAAGRGRIVFDLFLFLFRRRRKKEAGKREAIGVSGFSANSLPVFFAHLDAKSSN